MYRLGVVCSKINCEKSVLPDEFVSDVITHMNSDHADSLRDYAVAFGGQNNPEHVELIKIDQTQMQLLCRSAGEVVEISVPLLSAVKRPEQLRGMLVAMAKRAREEISRGQ